MLNAPPALIRPAPLAQGSDQPPQTFKESLFAASRASSDVVGVHQDGARTGKRQTPASDDTRSPRATLHSGVVLLSDPLQQTVQQLAPPAQQLPVIDPAPVVPAQLQEGAGNAPKAATLAVASARDGAALNFPSTGSNIAPPVGAKQANIPSGDIQKQGEASQVVPTLPPVGYGSQVATNLSAAATTATPVAPTNTVPDPPSNTVPSDVAGSAPSVVPDAVRALVPVIVSGAVQDAVPSSASAPSALQHPLPATAPIAVPDTPAKSISDTVAKTSPDAMHHVTETEVPAAAQNSTSSPSANVSSDATPVSISHDHVAKGDVVVKSNAVPVNNPPSPPAAPAGPATVPGIPDPTVDQLAALIQPAGALPVTVPAHAFDVSPAAVEKPSDAAGADRKDGLSNSINDVTGLTQHGSSESAPAPSQPAPQDTSPSGDQGQGSASQPGQNVATTQGNFPSHNVTVVDHPQNPGVAVLSPTTPAPAGVSDHAAKAPQTAALPTVVVPQPVPVINTARLIQSMGQSEMRVGMHSTDFGNISITTSATRDLISAQISLDHGELARTLATHLPEMQAKFGGDQAMNVRIDTNGQPAGQSAGTSASMSNGSADHSRSDPQQRGSGTSRQSREGFAGELNAIPAAVLPSAESRLDARLDIRV